MMKSSREVSEYLDLTFLSADEELAIRQVLHRDDNLRQRETGRIRRLRHSINDPGQLRFKSGEWFRELRARRYGRQSEPTEVVRSSMRKKKTPAPRGNFHSDVRKADNKEGEKEKNEPQTKTSGIQTPYTSFLNPAFRDEANRERINEKITETKTTSVDVSEEKLSLHRPHKETASEEISTNPFVFSNPETPYFSTTDTDHQSLNLKSGENLEGESSHAGNADIESQTGPTALSCPDFLTNLITEASDTITYLESSGGLAVPPEIRDGKKQSSASVDPNTWTLPEVEDSFKEEDREKNALTGVVPEVEDSVKEDREMTPAKVHTGVLSPSGEEQDGTEDTPSLKILVQSSRIRPKPKDPNTWTPPEVEDSFKEEDREMTPAKAHTGVLSPSGEEQDRTENTPSLKILVQSSRIRPKPKDPNTWTLPEVEDSFKEEDREMTPAKAHTGEQDRTEDTPSLEISVQSSRIRPKPKEDVNTGAMYTMEKPHGDDLLNRSENNRSRDGELREHEESPSSPFSEILNQSDPLKLDYEDVWNNDPLKLSQDVSITDCQEPQLAMDQSFSEPPLLDETQSLCRNYPLPIIEASETTKHPQQSRQETLKAVAIGTHISVDDSSTKEEAEPGMDSVVSSDRCSPFAVRSVEEDIVLPSDLYKPKEDTGVEKEEKLKELSKKRLPETEKVEDMTHDIEMDPKVSTGVLGEENMKPMQFLNQTYKKESLSKAVDGQTSSLDVDEIEKSEEETEDKLPSTLDKSPVKSKSSASEEFITTQDVNLERVNYPIPQIVVFSSESPATDETEEQPDATQKKPSEGGKPMETLEDEALDSEDDHSSVSSLGSEFSNRRGFGSSNALSVSGRTGSLLSVYSDAGDFGNVTVQGAVEFALRYSKAGEFIISIEQCQDLAYGNARKLRTDPYVKTYLYPDKSRHSKKKTSIKKRTVNPIYGGETLKYKLKMDELKGRTLNLSVWHNDSRGRNVFLGQVEINLKTWDWGHEALTWYNLQPKNPEGQECPEYHGLLTVALKYVPPASTDGAQATSGEIHVWLKEARELKRLKPQGVDSFVKCYMLPDTSKKSRQKTRVMKKSQEPVYNHAMVYDGFRSTEVREACCELTIWDHNKLSNQFLGGVRLSLGTGQSYGKKVDWMDSVNQEIQLWEKMLSSPNVWVEGEIPLRSSMTPRK